MLESIHIILVGITHPGNIGAAARAMKTMGLSQLVLVAPQQFPDAQATARASGADDILANAQIFDNFETSLADYQLVLATSARQRSIAWPALTPQSAAEKALLCTGQVAIVFGREHAGLTNQELDRCHYLITIPTRMDFSSMNVAAAVQIMAYELFQLFLTQQHSKNMEQTPELLANQLASAAAINQFYQQLEHTLIEIGFLDPEKPRRLMRRLRRLFNRTQLMNSELNILRGILSAMQAHKRNQG
ncbi:MAG: RNA methyltransferase [Pseudomonadota bacterium]|nr:RNA methyltransferase [Pseudomonadota bacterium]